MNLYKTCITIKKVSSYFFVCFKAFLICRGKDKITTFENIALFYEDIDSCQGLGGNGYQYRYHG